MKNLYNNTYGTWDVTTDGDCEGRSTKRNTTLSFETLVSLEPSIQKFEENDGISIANAFNAMTFEELKIEYISDSLWEFVDNTAADAKLAELAQE